MKQVWDLLVAHLKMAHVAGRTSVLASVSGWEEGMPLSKLDPLWTTQWALNWVRPHPNMTYTPFIYDETSYLSELRGYKLCQCFTGTKSAQILWTLYKAELLLFIEIIFIATRVLFFQLSANFDHSFLVGKHAFVKRVKEAEYGSEILLVFPLFPICLLLVLHVYVVATFSYPLSIVLAWACLILMLILNISFTLIYSNSVRSRLQLCHHLLSIYFPDHWNRLWKKEGKNEQMEQKWHKKSCHCLHCTLNSIQLKIKEVYKFQAAR